MKKLLALGLILSLLTPNAFALKVNGQLEKALLENLASDPTGKAGRIYFNTTSKKAKVHDGSAWAEVGSGSGGGGAFTNFATNGAFESGTTGWTASAGTFAVTTAAGNKYSGVNSGSWTPNASDDTLSNTGFGITSGGGPSGNGAVTCMVKTSGAAHSLRVLDGANVLNSVTISASTSFVPVSVNFAFPATSTGINFDIKAGGTEAIYLDECFIGDARAVNLSNISQAQFVGKAYFPTCASCLFSRGYNTFGSFGAVAAFPGITVESSKIGQWLTTDYDLPKFTINNLPPGIYRIITTAAIYESGGSSPSITLSDGTTSSGNGTGDYAGASAQATIESVFEYTTTGNRTFEILGRAATGTAYLANDYVGREIHVAIYRFPLQSEIAVTPDLTSYLVDATINASVDLGVSTVSSYSDIPNSSMSLVAAPTSSPVGIACGNPAAGQQIVGNTTCDALGQSESIGIVFSVPRAGKYRACFESFLQIGVNATSSRADVYFKTVETPVNALTELQSSNAPVSIAHLQTSVITIPVSSCSVFNFTSAGTKVLRTYYKQTATGTITTSWLAGYNHFTVIGIDQSVPSPVIQNQVSTSNSGGIKVEYITFGGAAEPDVCTSSPCNILKQSGAFSAVTRASAGNYTVTLNSGIFNASVRPVCTCTPTYTVDNTWCKADPTGATTVLVGAFKDTTTRQDARIDMICVGPK